MAVIKHEAPDLRRHVRCEVPIRVRIRGTDYLVKDWSLGGFRVEDFPAAGLDVGDRLFAGLVLTYQGLEVSFTAEVEVVRLSGAGQSLFRVEDDVLTRDLELAGVQLAATKVDLDTAEARVRKEREKVARYRGLTEAKRNRAQAQVESLGRQAKAARAMLERAQKLT